MDYISSTSRLRPRIPEFCNSESARRGIEQCARQDHPDDSLLSFFAVDARIFNVFEGTRRGHQPFLSVDEIARTLEPLGKSFKFHLNSRVGSALRSSLALCGGIRQGIGGVRGELFGLREGLLFAHEVGEIVDAESLAPELCAQQLQGLLCGAALIG